MGTLPSRNADALRLFRYHHFLLTGMSTLLIVEDQKNLSLALKEYFEAYGFIVLNAHNGLDALRLLKTKEPDLIISDVNMPRMNGLEFISKVRQSFNGAKIPILILSANTDEHSMLRGLEIGANDYICKPFKFEALFFKVRNLLSLNKAQAQVTEVEDEPWSEIIQVIEAHMQRPTFSLDEFAKALNCSPSTAQRRLKKATGRTFTQQLMVTRLEHANEHIRNYPERSLGEIAEMVGFSSLSYFSTVFKNYFGQAPSKVKA